ncbi:MAG TPA: hypothetical protein VLA51_12925 [Paracoccaceae bacterium]|nr:hypothetical protein [Paracoccaceae bacterium]
MIWSIPRQAKQELGLLNVLAVVQEGRLAYEALAFMASFRRFNADSAHKVYLAEPQPGPLWPFDPRIQNRAVRTMLTDLGAEIVPLHSKVFGAEYPYGCKIEAPLLLPEGEPFLFLDTDTLFTGPLDDVPFDFDRPSASLRRTDTWPQPDLYGPGYAAIWQSLYQRFGLDFESSLDLSEPEEYWKRYLYFNAGFFYYRCPKVFGTKYLQYAQEIRDNPPPELDGQVMDPWLDQVALPLVIHALGGGREALASGHLDGSVTCHYRGLPLLYAREDEAVLDVLEAVIAPNKIKRLLKESEPFKRLVYQGKGRKLREKLTPEDLAKPEMKLRRKIKNLGYWMR